MQFFKTTKIMPLFSNKRKIELLINYGLLIIVGAIQIIYPLFLSEVVNSSVTNSTVLYSCAVIVSILILSKLMIQIVQNYISSKTGWGILTELRENLCNKLTSMDYIQVQKENAGTITQTVERDTEQVVNFYLSFIGIFIKDAVLLIGVCTAAYFASFYIGLFLTALILVMFLCFSFINKTSKTAWENSKETSAGFMNAFCDVFRCMDEFVWIRQDNFLKQFLLRTLHTFFQYDFVASYISYRFWLASLFSFGLSKIIILSIGIVLMQQTNISPGTVYLLIYYIDMLADPVEELRIQLEDIPAVSVATERILRLLHTDSGISYGKCTLQPPVQEIVFDHIDFQYEDKIIFHNFSEVIKSGNVYALVGNSGVGKSTLLNLMVRLYDTTSGSIRVNGIPVEEYCKDEIAHEICYLQQQKETDMTTTSFFGRDLPEHINEIKQYCHMLLYRDVLEQNSPLSELSRGEQQTLVLIRALITERSFILLDEVFDAVDREKVNTVLSVLRRQNKTVIVITHEKEVMSECDQIIDLNRTQVH